MSQPPVVKSRSFALQPWPPLPRRRSEISCSLQVASGVGGAVRSDVAETMVPGPFTRPRVRSAEGDPEGSCDPAPGGIRTFGCADFRHGAEVLFPCAHPRNYAFSAGPDGQAPHHCPLRRRGSSGRRGEAPVALRTKPDKYAGSLQPS